MSTQRLPDIDGTCRMPLSGDDSRRISCVIRGWLQTPLLCAQCRGRERRQLAGSAAGRRGGCLNVRSWRRHHPVSRFSPRWKVWKTVRWRVSYALAPPAAPPQASRPSGRARGAAPRLARARALHRAAQQRHFPPRCVLQLLAALCHGSASRRLELRVGGAAARSAQPILAGAASLSARKRSPTVPRGVGAGCCQPPHSRLAPLGAPGASLQRAASPGRPATVAPAPDRGRAAAALFALRATTPGSATACLRALLTPPCTRSRCWAACCAPAAAARAACCCCLQRWQRLRLPP